MTTVLQTRSLVKRFGGLAATNDVTLAIVNARVWTGNPRQPWATGIAASGDRIVSVSRHADVTEAV